MGGREVWLNSQIVQKYLKLVETKKGLTEAHVGYKIYQSVAFHMGKKKTKSLPLSLM